MNSCAISPWAIVVNEFRRVLNRNPVASFEELAANPRDVELIREV